MNHLKFKNIMKKILCLFLGLIVLSMSSCFKLDNWDEPDCTIYGTVIDSYTNQPLLSSQNDWQFRTWERSWTGHPGGATTNQDLRIKQDGTYQNTKYFAGTYDILPYNGPFWPMDTVKNVKINGKTELNFTVTPYLQIKDFSCEFGTNSADGYPTLIFKCKVRAPVTSKDGRNLARPLYLRCFLSFSVFCGNGSDSWIGTNVYPESLVRKEFSNDGNSDWANLFAAGPGDNTTEEYTFGPIRVKSGYTYHVRMGASVRDTHQKYSYSEIKKIVVP